MKLLPEFPDVDPDPLYELTQSLEKCLLLFTAMDLGIFDCLEMPKTAQQISAELKTEPRLTAKFLNSLVAIGLLEKEEPFYNNSPVSANYLVENSPFYQGNLLGLIKKNWQQRWLKLSDHLRPDDNQDERADRKLNDLFDKSFILAMAEGAMRGGVHSTLKIVRCLPEFANATSLLDLGGGHGLYAIGLCQANPKLECVLFDLPPVIEVAREFIARYKMQDRVHTLAGEFPTDDWGSGFDIIFASDALYKPRDLLVPVLDKIRGTLNEGGLFISKQWIISAERTAPVTTVLWDLMVSVSSNFKLHTYSEQEFTELLNQAGFKRIETFDISTASKPSVITVARKG